MEKVTVKSRGTSTGQSDNLISTIQTKWTEWVLEPSTSSFWADVPTTELFWLLTGLGILVRLYSPLHITDISFLKSPSQTLQLYGYWLNVSAIFPRVLQFFSNRDNGIYIAISINFQAQIREWIKYFWGWNPPSSPQYSIHNHMVLSYDVSYHIVLLYDLIFSTPAQIF